MLAENILATDQKIREELFRIGDLILSRAEKTEHGLTWDTVWVQPGTEKGYVYARMENMYNGVSGICLFLAELSRFTNQRLYMAAAVHGMDWVIYTHDRNPENFHALYSGKMSVAVVLCRFFELTDNRRYLDKAIEIAAGSIEFMNTITYDVINGLAGTLLGLLHVHAVSKDERLLLPIDICTDKLLRAMHAGANGICWDRIDLNIHSLCGYSHGVGGVAHAFHELGYYFNNPAFFEIARQAMIYEDQFLVKEVQNWRDLRGPIESVFAESIEQAYAAGDRNFFLIPKFMNAWCHGAAGIGLQRLRSSILSPIVDDVEVNRDIEVCISTTIRTTIHQSNHDESGCLCHGKAGNAEVLIQAARMNGDERSLEAAYRIAEDLLAQQLRHGRYISGNPMGVEDMSLFMGTAGVGYFFLRLLDSSTPPVLSLHMPHPFEGMINEKYPTLKLTATEIHRRLVSADFPRTHAIVNSLFPDQLNDYLATSVHKNFVGQWLKFVHGLIDEGLPKTDVVRDAVEMEIKALQLNLDIVSDNILYWKDKKKKKAASELLSSGSKLLSTELVVDSDPMVVTTRWPWSIRTKATWSENAGQDAGEYHYLLVPTSAGVDEMPISDFCRIVLEHFESPSSITDIVPSIASYFDEDESHEQIQLLVQQQVSHLIEKGILLEPAKHRMNRKQVMVKVPVEI